MREEGKSKWLSDVCVGYVRMLRDSDKKMAPRWIWKYF